MSDMRVRFPPDAPFINNNMNELITTSRKALIEAKKSPIQELVDNNVGRAGKTLIDGSGKEVKDAYWLGSKEILGGRSTLAYAVNVKQQDALSKEKSITLLRYNTTAQKVDSVSLPQEFVKDLKKVLFINN